MSILQGISGLNIGDGDGGNVALTIKTMVQEILDNNMLQTFLMATISNDIGANGTQAFYQPEIIATEEYTVGGNVTDVPQSNLISVNMDNFRKISYEVEEMDVERLANASAIIGIIANGTAKAMMADLNSHMYLGLIKFFTATANADKVLYNAAVAKLDSPETITFDESRKAGITIGAWNKKMVQIWNKKYLGASSRDTFALINELSEMGLIVGYSNPTSASEIVGWVLNAEIPVKNLWGFNYFLDNLIGNSITTNQSWNKDYALDLTNYIGFLIHKEAIAYPYKIVSMRMVINPNNSNPRFITKYMNGFEVIRPDLIRAMVKTDPSV